MNLDPGNILVFHSDGLSEATDPEGTFFGIPRIAALVEQNAALTSDQLADRLLAEVQEFTRGMAITDDRTLVVMKVR
jgi:sigma-B regulation protein RsbU (phosphoserine phosphatase)